jgi:hypothetical protein
VVLVESAKGRGHNAFEELREGCRLHWWGMWLKRAEQGGYCCEEFRCILGELKPLRVFNRAGFRIKGHNIYYINCLTEGIQ